MKPVSTGSEPEVVSVGWALASLSLSMLLASLGTSIANVGLPTLVQAFGASFQQVQWVVLAYLLAMTALIVSVGRLGDLLGRRRLLLAGILLFTLASMLCAVAPTLGMLIAARALQGVGAAIMMALTLALVGETVSKARTGSAMGLLGTMSAIGTALGPSLGGVLIAGFGWQALFLVCVPLGGLTCALAYRCLPAAGQARDLERGAFDPLGTLLLAFTLLAYGLAMTLGRGHFGLLNVGLLVVALLAAGLFVWVEARVAAPLIRLALFRDAALSGSLAMSALVSTVMMATLVVGPFYLAHGLGLETFAVGLAMSLGPCVTALSGVPAGRIADQFGVQPMILAGLGAMALGCLMLALLPASLGIGGYLGPMVITTLGYATFQTANNTAVMSDVGAEQRGVISGLLNLSRNLGLITGASLMGAVFAAVAGDLSTASAEAVASGMGFTFVLATGLVLMALLAALLSQQRRWRTLDSVA
ncbi:MFS transporter [Pseudomonas chlororaphis]|uniref:Transmembrane transport protein n=1 Tax=Pseudomonas chlororaphis TaxID=587753 RepID=A0AAX3FR67_9PSED|nr:MFS transporter [Pseudomonas chlororaphis]AZC38754.1 Putative transport protein [Pseudomonas chlororaphis subsp. piscium]AZC45304.1 Putative transport protein [Pseudomonas chlororaphis subsp. piscium]WDG70869.1 MFS transporter [Pseudomonas chlororaphis]WDH31345.1 MFS transporter [Pseudomonas chlororaphis]WDH69395.1 MFS transporter [Pseudomonas chlororaphis]